MTGGCDDIKVNRAASGGWMTCIILCFLLISCTDRSPLLPDGAGKPNEVLVVGDHDGVIRDALSEDMVGLPQAEPEFDVSSIDKERYNRIVQSARNIVVVDIDKKAYPKAKITYARNVYARLQLIITVGMPDVKTLNAYQRQISREIVPLVRQNEMERELQALQKKNNIKASRKVEDMFGLKLLVPSDLTSHKHGKDFLWLSNDDAQAMLNICIYRIKTTEKTPEAILMDSVMKENIKGETDSMYMQTVRNTLTMTQSLVQKQASWTIRGLWEMKGDSMGGPFVARMMYKNGYQYVVEAFIYAPGLKKRDKIKRLEAVLQTMRFA